MNLGIVLLGLIFLSSPNFINATHDYVCSKERKPTEHWFVTFLPPEDIEGARYAEVRDESNEKGFLLFCENLPYKGIYTCHNSISEAFEEGSVIFYPAPHYYPSLEIHFSNAEESTTTIHYYKCERDNEV
jgi:hypothetical protein